VGLIGLIFVVRTAHAAPSVEPLADVTDGGSGAHGLDGAQRSAMRQPGSTNRRQRVAKQVRFADGV